MDEGPRYPGSLVVQHVRQQTMELVDKYKRRRKRATELPRAVSLLLAWEGAIVAGAFLLAIGHVAASAYMMERFDERTRRSSLVRYYQQRTELAREAVRHLQASIAYYSRHSAAVERRLEFSTATARECRVRLSERRRQLEQELAAVLGTPTVSGANGGHSNSSGGGGGSGGSLALMLAPYRVLLMKWRLKGWHRELERLDRETHQLEQSLRHDQLLAEQARRKLHSLAKELRREAAAYEALQSRLQAWRSYSCRSMVFSGGGQLGVPGLSWVQGLLRRRGSNRLNGPEGEDNGSEQAGKGHGDGNGAEGALEPSSSSSSSSSGYQVLWSWTMQVYTPAWMDDDEGFEPPPPRGEAPGDRDEDDNEDEVGNRGDGAARGGGGGIVGDLLAELRPLLANAVPRW